MAIFYGYEVTSTILSETECMSLAVDGRLRELFGVDDDGTFAPDINQVKPWAMSILLDWRGDRRKAIGLTSASFQELCYTGKALEAMRWLTDQTSDFGLRAEAAARGITNLELATLVKDQWDSWQAASDEIEAEYVTVHSQLAQAATIEAIEAILTALAVD